MEEEEEDDVYYEDIDPEPPFGKIGYGILLYASKSDIIVGEKSRLITVWSGGVKPYTWVLYRGEGYSVPTEEYMRLSPLSEQIVVADFSPAKPGQYNFLAMVTDARGASIRSDVVTIIVRKDTTKRKTMVAKDDWEIERSIHGDLYSYGHKIGYDRGVKDGSEAGNRYWLTKDITSGYNDGYMHGYFKGHAQGYINSYNTNYNEGWMDGYLKALREMKLPANLSTSISTYTKWYNKGYTDGYYDGHDDGDKNLSDLAREVKEEKVITQKEAIQKVFTPSFSAPSIDDAFRSIMRRSMRKKIMEKLRREGRRGGRGEEGGRKEGGLI